MSEAVARALLWLGRPLEIWLWAGEDELDDALADQNWAPSANALRASQWPAPEEDGDAA